MSRSIFLILAIAILGIGTLTVLASDSTTALFNTPISITGPDGVCKRVTNASGTGLSAYIPTTSAAEWQSFVANPPSGVTLASCATGITVPCGNNINLYTLAGSPGSAGAYNFTVPANCTVGSASTAQPALATGSWPAGSSITLTNNGTIVGKGGAGGAGGYVYSYPVGYYDTEGTYYQYTNWAAAGGSSGTAGGVSISLSYPISIDTTNGFIYGGGGGGGGGSVFPASQSNDYGGTGGAGAGPGAATGGSTGYYPGYNAGSGGTGGSYGAAGAVGNWSPAYGTSGSAPGAGGAAGNAITRNGHTVTWLGGNDSTHVKGAVQ